MVCPDWRPIDASAPSPAPIAAERRRGRSGGGLFDLEDGSFGRFGQPAT
jgi:hypothetical protein